MPEADIFRRPIRKIQTRLRPVPIDMRSTSVFDSCAGMNIAKDTYRVEENSGDLQYCCDPGVPRLPEAEKDARVYLLTVPRDR